MSDKTAKLELGGESYEFDVHSGTLGPDVMDISSLYASTGAFTYDPGFTSTASCESDITFINGEEGVLLHRGYPIDQLAEKGSLPRGLLPAALRRTAEQGADGRLRVSRDPPHDGARADEPVLHRLPPRCPPHGHHVRRGRRDERVLPRLHRHLRSAPADDRLAAHDRQDADHRRHGVQVSHRPALRLSEERPRPTPATSCACALRCRARTTR